ncbi:glucokinase [Azospirillum sp. INR13]|uniref:glucokinase n=1 Tax=Azospirillum sp. INR13 TaxID=2596919 RepID=UPI00351CAAB0
MSGLVPGANGRWTALSGEGGHVTMAPISDRESAVLGQLRKGFDHVSAERGAVGAGPRQPLQRPVDPRRARTGRPHPRPDHRQCAGRDRAPLRGGGGDVLRHAGHRRRQPRLDAGRAGGVYIAGGIVPRLGTLFAHSRFRKRFAEKGRMRDFLAPIPTYVVTHELPAFLGLAEAAGAE